MQRILHILGTTSLALALLTTPAAAHDTGAAIGGEEGWLPIGQIDPAIGGEEGWRPTDGGDVSGGESGMQGGAALSAAPAAWPANTSVGSIPDQVDDSVPTSSLAYEDVLDLPFGVGAGCADVPVDGLCADGLLTWCDDDGTKHEVDCGAEGQTCGWDLGNGFFGCIDEQFTIVSIDDLAQPKVASGTELLEAASDAGCSGTGAGPSHALLVLAAMALLLGLRRREA